MFPFYLSAFESLFIVFLVFMFLFGARYMYRVMVGKMHSLEALRQLFMQQKYPDVIEKGVKLLTKYPEDVYVQLLIAEAHYSMEEWDEAMPYFERIEAQQAYTKSQLEPEDDIQVHRRLLQLYRRKSNVNAILGQLMALVELDVDQVDWLKQLAQALYQAKRPQEALHYVQEAFLKMGDRDAGLTYLMGLCYVQLARPSDAKACFERALHLKSRYPEAAFQLAELLRGSGSYREAVSLYSMAEGSANPLEATQAAFFFGQCQHHLEQIPIALAAYQRALQQAEAHQMQDRVIVGIRYAIASVYEQEGNLAWALREWEHIQTLVPAFRDVESKILHFRHLAMNDQMKEFFTARDDVFLEFCRNMLYGLDLVVVTASMESSDLYTAVCTQEIGRYRDEGKAFCCVYVDRQTKHVQQAQLETLMDKMQSTRSTRGVYISTGYFVPSAEEYAQNRPIYLYDRDQLSTLLLQMEEEK